MWSDERLAELKQKVVDNPYDGGGLARCILVHACVGSHEESSAIFTRVSPFFKGTCLQRLLSDVAGNRVIIREQEGLFIVGEHSQALYNRLENAARDTRCLLGSDLPCIVVEVAADGSSFSLHEIDGVSMVKLAASPEDFTRAAVHEFTHCVIRANHRFFDEGLATLMEYRVDVKNELPREVVLSKPLRLLIADRRLDRPCFDEQGDYVAAAKVVDWMWNKAGIHSLSDWFSTVKDLDDDALVSVFESLCGTSVESMEAKLFKPVKHIHGVFDHAAIDLAFLFGDARAVRDTLPVLRSAFSDVQDTRVLESLVKVLLLHVDSEPLVLTETESLVNTYLERNPDSEAADMFLFILEAQRVRRAANFLVMHESLAVARRLLENLLERYPRSLSVLLSAAKFQLSSPVEYGGGIDSARVYLDRALALGVDGAMGQALRKVIERLEEHSFNLST